jgi:hypothetical protein
LGGAKVEDLECQQSADDHQAPGSATIEAASAGQVTEQGSQAIPRIFTVNSHFSLHCCLNDNEDILERLF